jgi:HSP20 family protein
MLSRGEPDIFGMDRVFENFFNDTVFPALYSRSGQMKVDVRENENEYLVEADLPGFKKEDISVDYDDETLTISAKCDETKEEKDEKDANYLRRERVACSTTRSFTVPDIDAEKISAAMEHGVLKVTLPKLKVTKPKGRKIDIG